MAERRREHARRLDLAVGKHHERRLLHDVRDLVLGEEAQAPVDPLGDPELPRELLVRLGGLDRVARHDETDVGHLLRDRRQRADEEIEPLRAADEPEEEERRAPRRRDLARGREDGVRDPHDLRAVDAESGQLLDGAGAVDDDAIDGREHAPPEVELVGGPPREHVVSREDDRPLPLRRLQPAQVVARQPQPLHVQHVGVEPRDLFLEPPRARRVLEPLHDEAEAGSRIAAQHARAAGEEHVVLAKAIRRRQLREQEARREEIHLVPTPRQRPGEAAVVGNRVADGIGEADPHDA